MSDKSESWTIDLDNSDSRQAASNRFGPAAEMYLKRHVGLLRYRFYEQDVAHTRQASPAVLLCRHSLYFVYAR